MMTRPTIADMRQDTQRLREASTGLRQMLQTGRTDLAILLVASVEELTERIDAELLQRQAEQN